MLNLNELEQFVAFSEYGTLSEVSEVMNISQPTLTRNMKHVEDSFGVSLFTRQKNRLVLNEAGWVAVEYAKQLLRDEEHAVFMVKEFDRKQRSITISSCAPAPLWLLSPKLSSAYPDNTIVSSICDTNKILQDVKTDMIDIGILPYEMMDTSLDDTIFFTENLSVCIPFEHELSKKEFVSFADLNGYNCLLRDQLGFWTDLCKKEMPASKFLIQTDESEFLELVRSSILFCFTTNIASYPDDILASRKILPIIDEDANVTYHLIWKKGREYRI